MAKAKLDAIFKRQGEVAAARALEADKQERYNHPTAVKAREQVRDNTIRNTKSRKAAIWDTVLAKPPAKKK